MELIFGTLPPVSLEDGETARRLQVPRGFSVDGTDRCLAELKRAAVYRYVYAKVPITALSEKRLQFGFAETKSGDLARNLVGCREAFLMAVTLGIDVDRLLMRKSRLSEAEHFVTDALASAMAEALCDELNARLGGEYSLKPRFSPGYGDFPLTFQRSLLSALQAERTVGITLNDACLMTPSKSITAIAGIENEV